MTEPVGALCLVLHGHLPYVLHHGAWPHGEAWLHEAAAESYLPLLDLIGAAALHKVRPALTVGLTPVLLEQLAHERFKAGLAAYLADGSDRARRDRREFEARGQSHFAALADGWDRWYAARLAHFERVGRDIPGEFAARCREGHVQILTGPATHPYVPLLLRDSSLRAQLACGTASTQSRLGLRCTGLWLPECGYRPAADQWKPPVLYDDPRPRAGLEQLIADAGCSHFFVDTHLVTGATPLGVTEAGRFRDTSQAQLWWDRDRGWGNALRPVGVAAVPEAARAFAFARHPRAGEQVWSGVIGYPGSGEYLDFHRKHPGSHLRYHRVTDSRSGQADKHPYDPDQTPAKLYEHAQHFCGLVREVLREFREQAGRPGVCVAPFDAELFGHWWFEGPQFLRDVLFTLARDGSVELLTAEQALDRHPADMVVRMPEGSWGEGGRHGVWLNDRTRWMWEAEYRAEDRMSALVRDLPWQANEAVRAMVERAGRELLLLQASDWPFVVHSNGAVDYGIGRFAGHSTRFDRMANIAVELGRGNPLGPLERVQVQEADAHDGIFPTIDPGWWT